jgi:vacuolar iron transporter family protein
MLVATRGEGHLVHRVGWLRAAVLGANDGIISTSSLVVGVAAADVAVSTILLTGIAALVGGAISMAAGEYVSVSSQADLERADRRREEREQADAPEAEREELAALYRQRGLDSDLAQQVADQLMLRDPIAAHMRDELGITDQTTARPLQAALASAASFCAGAIVPVLLIPLTPTGYLVGVLIAVSLVLLAVLGAAGAVAGGANIFRGAARVTFWGALAMGATALIGRLFGARV